jgi:hypothetical protein
MREVAYRRGVWCLLILLMGCSHWEPYAAPTVPVPDLPSSLRVWTRGGANVLVQPFVRGDTLYGRLGSDTLVIPLSAVQRFERPRLEVGRTVATVVGGLGLWITAGLFGGGLE